MTAREEILARITTASNNNLAQAQDAWLRITRDYQQAAGRTRAEIVALFTERLHDYGAGVHVADTESDIAPLIAQLLTERYATNIVHAPGLPAHWLPASHRFTPDDNFDALTLAGFAGTITGATLGIADSGTILLQHTPTEGRRAITLVPDYHLCVLHRSTIVETAVEAMRQLEATSARPTTFFSGPSATADIEMTRIKGVHGPRFLDVILISD